MKNVKVFLITKLVVAVVTPSSKVTVTDVDDGASATESAFELIPSLESIVYFNWYVLSLDISELVSVTVSWQGFSVHGSGPMSAPLIAGSNENPLGCLPS